MNSIRYFVDAWSLFSDKYTGIQNVNYQIVKYFFTNLREQTVIFYQSNVLHESAIKSILTNRNGKKLSGLRDQNCLFCESVYKYLKKKEKTSICIYPCIKNFHRTFDYEIQIIYDITFLLTPEFHNQDNIHLHESRILKSLQTNDLNVCISESTKEDIITYLQVQREKTMVAYPGCDNEWKNNDSLYTQIISSSRVEPFILILGTVEPRKNIMLVLQFLERFPEELQRYRFIFIGNDGWGKSFNEHLFELKLPEKLKKRRIKHLNFVSEEEKNILLMTARFMIFPSFYEGFGLPVLEAMSFGCPVLASMSSSIPEIGEDVVQYFDPYSIDSFTTAFRSLEKKLESGRKEIRENGFKRAENFTWNNFVKNIIERVNSDIDGNHIR